MTYTFNDTQMTEFNRLVARYPEGKQKSALLPALHLAQDSFDGWLPTELMDYIASLLKIEPIEGPFWARKAEILHSNLP